MTQKRNVMGRANQLSSEKDLQPSGDKTNVTRIAKRESKNYDNSGTIAM